MCPRGRPSVGPVCSSTAARPPLVCGCALRVCSASVDRRGGSERSDSGAHPSPRARVCATRRCVAC
eukprot:3410904-Prymnesium_polylepis.2